MLTPRRLTHAKAMRLLAIRAASGLPTQHSSLIMVKRTNSGVSQADDLRRGFVARSFLGQSKCRICGRLVAFACELSDGTFIWPEGLSHYVLEGVGFDFRWSLPGTQ